MSRRKQKRPQQLVNSDPGGPKLLQGERLTFILRLSFKCCFNSGEMKLEEQFTFRVGNKTRERYTEKHQCSRDHVTNNASELMDQEKFTRVS